MIMQLAEKCWNVLKVVCFLLWKSRSDLNKYKLKILIENSWREFKAFSVLLLLLVCIWLNEFCTIRGANKHQNDCMEIQETQLVNIKCCMNDLELINFIVILFCGFELGEDKYLNFHPCAALFKLLKKWWMLVAVNWNEN